MKIFFKDYPIIKECLKNAYYLVDIQETKTIVQHKTRSIIIYTFENTLIINNETLIEHDYDLTSFKRTIKHKKDDNSKTKELELFSTKNKFQKKNYLIKKKQVIYLKMVRKYKLN